jgi:preprotein translocase subunit YajC
MKRVLLIIGLIAAVTACSRTDALEIPTGSDVTVQKKNGVQVSGRLVEVQAKDVILETADGTKLQVPRSDIASVKATPVFEKATAAAPIAPIATTGVEKAEKKDGANPLTKLFTRGPEYREVTIPAGTVLPVALTTGVGSDTSSVEDAVSGTLRRAITIDGLVAIPAGTAVAGHVTSAQRPGKVKGRGAIAFRFNQLDLPGEGDRVAIQTRTISRLAPATKKRDAAKIGAGAAGGAIVGGILGGGDGAAKGAAIGGGAGTAVVLSTRGKDIRLGAGAPVSVRLTAPVTFRVAVK